MLYKPLKDGEQIVQLINTKKQRENFLEIQNFHFIIN